MSIYRQYEDPYKLEKELADLKSRQEELKLKAEQDGEDSPLWDQLNDLSQDIAEMEDRVNFAWQDDEYEHNHEDY